MADKLIARNDTNRDGKVGTGDDTGGIATMHAFVTGAAGRSTMTRQAIIGAILRDHAGADGRAPLSKAEKTDLNRQLAQLELIGSWSQGAPALEQRTVAAVAASGFAALDLNGDGTASAADLTGVRTKARTAMTQTLAHLSGGSGQISAAEFASKVARFDTLAGDTLAKRADADPALPPSGSGTSATVGGSPWTDGAALATGGAGATYTARG